MPQIYFIGRYFASRNCLLFEKEQPCSLKKNCFARKKRKKNALAEHEIADPQEDVSENPGSMRVFSDTLEKTTKRLKIYAKRFFEV